MSFYSPVLVANPDFAWGQAVGALRGCGALGSHLLLGFDPVAVYLAESSTHGHVYIVGPPNSGKSSRVLAPLLTQLIEGGHPVFCVDCKPDPLLLGHLRAAAAAAGRKFQFFSLQPGVPSGMSLECFEALADREPRHIAEFLVGSLGLNKASEPYFVSQNSGALTLAIRQARSKGRLSFRALAHELRGILSAESQRFPHAVHALDVIEQLADLPELNPGRGGLPAVSPRELVSDGAVCYFCLPVSTELKLTSAAVASILLKLTSSATKDLAIEGAKTKRIYFAIDEFQDVASSSDLKELVAQVRGVGGGVSLILSHQVPEQLVDEGLRMLLINASLVVLLAPRQFARELQEWSGEKVVWLQGQSHSSSVGGSTGGGPGGGTWQDSWQEATSESWQQTIRPTTDLNLIQQVNALPGFGFVVVEGGYPVPLFFPHHVPKHVANARTESAFEHLDTSNGLTQPRVRAPSRPAAPKTASAATSPAPAAPRQSVEVSLAKRLERLFGRLAPTVLHPAVRRPR